jgi:hypothetical protein
MRREIKRFVERSNQPQKKIAGDENTEIQNKETIFGTEKNADGSPVQEVVKDGEPTPEIHNKETLFGTEKNNYSITPCDPETILLLSIVPSAGDETGYDQFGVRRRGSLVSLWINFPWNPKRRPSRRTPRPESSSFFQARSLRRASPDPNISQPAV